jgi:hypothetical protein
MSDLLVNNLVKGYRVKLRDYIGDVVITGLSLLPYSNCEVTIIDMPKPYQSKFPNIVALCEPYGPSAFYLCVAPGQSRSTLLAAIAHELIHLGQYLRGELVLAPDKKSLTYQGDVFYPPYDPTQPHEVVAYREGPKLAKQVKSTMRAAKKA